MRANSWPGTSHPADTQYKDDEGHVPLSAGARLRYSNTSERGLLLPMRQSGMLESHPLLAPWRSQQ